MSKGYNVESDHILKTEYQCLHCGSWINAKGILDDKNRTSKKRFCNYCETAAKRKEIDEENKKIFSK